MRTRLKGLSLNFNTFFTQKRENFRDVAPLKPTVWRRSRCRRRRDCRSSAIGLQGRVSYERIVSEAHWS